jgi:hypothetical protein
MTIRKFPNIQDRHYTYDSDTETFRCKQCGTEHTEWEALVHLLGEHDYDRIDIFLDEPLGE